MGEEWKRRKNAVLDSLSQGTKITNAIRKIILTAVHAWRGQNEIIKA